MDLKMSFEERQKGQVAELSLLEHVQERKQEQGHDGTQAVPPALRALPATYPKGEMKTSLDGYPEYVEHKLLLTAPGMP